MGRRRPSSRLVQARLRGHHEAGSGRAEESWKLEPVVSTTNCNCRVKKHGRSATGGRTRRGVRPPLIPLLFFQSRTKKLLEKFPFLSLTGSGEKGAQALESTSVPSEMFPVYKVGLFHEIIGMEI